MFDPRVDNIWLSLLKGGASRQQREALAEIEKSFVNKNLGFQDRVYPQLSQTDTLIVREIEAEGFSVIKNDWHVNFIRFANELSAQLLELPVSFAAVDNGRIIGQGMCNAVAESEIPITGHYHSSDLLKLGPVQNLLSLPQLHMIPWRYFGCIPTVSSVQAWWSYPSKTGPSGAQLFHHDRGGFVSLNLFVYLCDVDKDNGPHVFSPKTHRFDYLHKIGNQISDGEQKRAYWDWIEQHRKSDEDITRFFETIALTGALGTAFFEDTRGFHKGTIPRNRSRLVFEIVWTVIPQFNSSLRSVGTCTAIDEAGSWLAWVNRLAFNHQPGK